MAYCHRDGDARSCGASTIVTGQDFVFVDGHLWSVDGDENTDGGGSLFAAGSTSVKINGLKVILAGDLSAPDSLCPIPGGPHCAPDAVGFDDLINVG